MKDLLSYAVWLADESDAMDRTKLPNGDPVLPGDYIIWRIREDSHVPIQAYETEAEAMIIADDLNYG